MRNNDSYGLPNPPVVAPSGYHTQPTGPWSAWPWGNSESQGQNYRQRRRRSSSPGRPRHRSPSTGASSGSEFPPDEDPHEAWFSADDDTTQGRNTPIWGLEKYI